MHNINDEANVQLQSHLLNIYLYTIIHIYYVQMVIVKTVPLNSSQPMSRQREVVREREMQRGRDKKNLGTIRVIYSKLLQTVNLSNNSCDDAQPVWKKTTDIQTHEDEGIHGRLVVFRQPRCGRPNVPSTSHNNIHWFFFFGFGFGHRTARIASSNTVFRPFCVSAEHSRYLTAVISLAIARPCG